MKKIQSGSLAEDEAWDFMKNGGGGVTLGQGCRSQRWGRCARRRGDAQGGNRVAEFEPGEVAPREA